MEIYSAYISEINSDCEKQITPLIISNEEKEDWHCLTLKKIICLFTWNNFRNISLVFTV